MMNFSLRIVSLLFCALSALPGVSFGEDSVTAAQRTLTKQGFYEGAANGQLDDPTRAALTRFQLRQGLPATGELTQATVKALNIPAKPAAAHPSVEPSVRERAHEVIRSDQDFLEKVEFLGRTDGVPAAPPAPVAERSTKSPIAPRPAAAVSADAPTPLGREDLKSFVDAYLTAAQSPSPEREMTYFADEVDYFDSGKVSRKFIEKDQLAYYRRWPSRKFTLTSEPRVEQTSDRGATVRFRIRYALNRGEENVSGRTENILRLKQTDAGLKIAGIRERKVTE